MPGFMLHRCTLYQSLQCVWHYGLCNTTPHVLESVLGDILHLLEHSYNQLEDSSSIHPQ